MSRWEIGAKITSAESWDAKYTCLDRHIDPSSAKDELNALFSCRNPGGGAWICYVEPIIVPIRKSHW